MKTGIDRALELAEKWSQHDDTGPDVAPLIGPVETIAVEPKQKEKDKRIRNRHNHRQSTNPERMLTLFDVAEDLCMSYESVRRLAKEHKIPVIMAGNVYRVPRKEFETWKKLQLESGPRSTKNQEGEKA